MKLKLNRTALAAATSIAAVLVAGTAALAANFGILGADDSIDDISAPSVVTMTSPTTIDALSPAAEAPPTTQAETLAYQVPGVGVVTLTRTGDSLDLVSVDVDSQWSWTEKSSDDEVSIQFTSDPTVIAFTAFVEDGEVIVNVMDETPVQAAPDTSSDRDDDYDDHDDYHEDDDDHEDHDHEDDEDHEDHDHEDDEDHEDRDDD